MEYRDKKDYAEFVPRQSWGADPLFPKGLPPLTSPVGNVVAVWTDTDPCSSLEECVAAVQAIQRKHVGEGLPDIRYNFLVGGDGRIYEGRGWRYQGPLYPATVQDHEDLNNNSIEIAFIDRPCEPNPKQMMTLSTLVVMGQDVKLVAAAFFFFYSKSEGKVERLDMFDPRGSRTLPS